MTESLQSFHEKPFVEQLEVVKRQFANEWEEMITGSGVFSEEEMRYADTLRAGGKLPKNHKWVTQKIVRIGQDYRLAPEQIDTMLAEITY